MGPAISGKALQVACVYGDFTEQLARRLTPEGELVVVDVAPVQLHNLNAKIKDRAGVSLRHQDSTKLEFPDEAFDNVVVFFLLHEQPRQARIKTIREALRVTRSGGKVVFVDYHRPVLGNPFRYVMIPILLTLEPFALDMWHNDILDWVPEALKPSAVTKQTYFGGLYQKVVMTR